MAVLQDREAERARARRRRNQLARAKGKAYRAARRVYADPNSLYRYGATWEDVFAARNLYVRYHYRNRKRCSCHMCGNPRYFWKGADRLTRRELRIWPSFPGRFLSSIYDES